MTSKEPHVSDTGKQSAEPKRDLPSKPDEMALSASIPTSKGKNPASDVKGMNEVGNTAKPVSPDAQNQSDRRKSKSQSKSQLQPQLQP